MATDLSQLRVLLVHEWLYTWGGAERCLDEMLALLPQADIAVGFATPEMRATHESARRARETWAARVPGVRRHHRWFLPLHALAFATLDTTGYDLVVSLSHHFGKAVRARGRSAKHLCYCFSPPRYFWGMDAAYTPRASAMERAALASATGVMRAVDRKAAAGVDRFVGISRYVGERIMRAYGRESDVVYPPVRAKRAAPGAAGPRDGFLLTLGRLVPYKRVDLAIEAAQRLGMRLVVAGDGPERARLERSAGAHVEFTGDVGESEAAALLSQCAAFVFCAEEEFGIAPVEANAHGAPVVAFGRGGAAETMQDGVSGILFDRQDAVSVASAIERCLATRWDPERLRENAARFSPERFRDGVRACIERTLGT